MTTSEQRERIALYEKKKAAREAVKKEFQCCQPVCASCVSGCTQGGLDPDPNDMAEAIVQLRAQLAAAEEENRHRAECEQSLSRMVLDQENEIAALRTRAERAELETAYIRRAFRGAVESDKLAITYQTIGSYRAGLLKTLNALDTRDGQGAG